MRDDPATAGLAPGREADDRHRPEASSRSTAHRPRLHDRPARAVRRRRATRRPSSSSPPAPPASPRAWCMPTAGSRRSATATAPACRRSRATSSSPPANGASSARSATTCCFRCATAPPARSWRTAPRPSASCRPSSATASRCCTRVATLYRRILATPGIESRYDLSSLRGANSTGEPLEDAVRKEWQARFGCPIWEHYGISEAQMVIGDGPDIPKKEGSTGRTWGARAAVIDENLNALPPDSDRHARLRRRLSRLLPRLSRRRGDDARDAARRLVRHQRPRPHRRRRLRLHHGPRRRLLQKQGRADRAARAGGRDPGARLVRRGLRVPDPRPRDRQPDRRGAGAAPGRRRASSPTGRR